MIEKQETTNQIALLNQEFLTSWELCTGTFPEAELFDRPGIATRWANIDFRFYNALCLTAELYGEGVLVQTVCQGVDFMRARPYPGWMVVTRESLSDPAQSALSGLIVSMRLA